MDEANADNVGQLIRRHRVQYEVNPITFWPRTKEYYLASVSNYRKRHLRNRAVVTERWT